MNRRAGLESVLAAIALVLSTCIGTAHAADIDIAPADDPATTLERLQEALILAAPGDTVRLAPGTFRLTAGLSLDVDDVSIVGAGPDRTILSFKDQTAGGEGLLVTSDRVLLEGFAVEDTKGDAIKSNGSDTITFRNLRTEWTNGPAETNGAYGLYPVSSRNVLIENCEAIGASDAGIYVGQSQDIIVRNSRAAFNVAGIEIENSYRADVYGNEATRNTGGILIFDLPGLPQQGGHAVRVFNNRVIDNDTPNFAPEGNIVGSVPTGTGIMVMANRDVAVFDNDIAGNGTVNVLIVSYPNEYEDEAYDPYPRGIYVQANRIGAGGGSPDNEIGTLIAEIAGTPVPDIVWDGVSPFWTYLFGPSAGDGIYVGDNIATDEGGTVDFADLDAPMWYAFRPLHSVNRERRVAEPIALTPVELPQDGKPE